MRAGKVSKANAAQAAAAAVAVGLAFTAVPGAVQAQTAAPASPSSTPSAPAATAATGNLEPITITVNKREERLQDVPATATVVPGKQLEQQNITTVQDLSRAIPTLTGSADTGLSLRGFGGISYSLTAEGSVGILIDGVSLSGAGDFPPNLFDVERVEVLEGPQGTLFGKNASAGVINIVTRSPDTRKFEGLARIEAQTRGGHAAQAAVNLPVSDTLALRLSGSLLVDPRTTLNRFDGAWDSPYKTNGRLRVLWKPTRDVVVNLSADQSDTTLRGGGRWTVYQSTPGSVLTKASAACGVTIGPENHEVCANPGQQGDNTHVSGYSAQVDWALGNYVLTSVTAVRDVTNNIPQADYDMIGLAAPAFSQPEKKTYHNLSQELRIASPDYDWGNFVAGAYWFNGKITQDITQVFQAPAFKAGQRNMIDGENTSTALFGQGTYKLTKSLSANLGLRIGHEEASTSRTGALIPGAVAALSPLRLVPLSAATSDSYTSWRAGLQYDFDASRMGYVTLAHGYKGPAVNHNSVNPGVPVVVKPEIPDMLEVGLKNQFMDGRLALNASVYTMKIKDYQANVWDPTTGAFVFSNAPELNNKGFVLNAYGKPTQSLTINGGLAWTQSRLGPGFLVTCAAGSPAGCTRDAAGDPAGGAPKLRAVLAMEYAFAIGSMRATLGTDIVHTSEKVYDRTDPARNLPGVTLVGARFGLRSADDKVGLTFYARNLFDKFNAVYRVPNLASFATGDTRSYIQFLGPESQRVVGLALDAAF